MFSSTAAAIAANVPPPVPRIELTANWADPAKVVAEKTSGASTPMPAARASRPNEAPKNQTVAATGIPARRPSR